MTEHEYLTLERAAEHKSEFIGGEVVAVKGKTIPSMLLAGKILSILDQQLDGSDAAPFPSNLRIRTPRGDYFYPDVSVIRQPFESHEGNADVGVNPVVMVDAISSSSTNGDRKNRVNSYLQIASLKEYLIVHSDVVHIEHHTRQANGSWLLQNYHGSADGNNLRSRTYFTLPSINCTLALGSIYAGAMDWSG